MEKHKPAMLAEVMEIFTPIPEGLFIDATLGDGGHAEALLLSHEQIMLLGLDRDAEAIKRAKHCLARFANRSIFINSSFDRLADELDALEAGELSGALFDLGVSSAQLDNPERGFSFRHEGALDMRMDQQQSLTAEEVVNKWSEAELADVIYEYGDERNSRAIARTIVKHRPLTTTLELAAVVAKAPRRRSSGKSSKRSSATHPARRTFQALRIYVNAELSQIAPALQAAVSRLLPGGRVVVLSYHSGEDKIVKQLFRSWEKSDPSVNLLHRKVRKPSKAEIDNNPRSRSVRLRSLEKVNTKAEVGK